MLRNLVVPAAIIAIALMTGCQAIQDNKTKPLEQPVPTAAPPSVPVDITTTTPEPESPKKKPQKIKPPIRAEIDPEPENIITVREQIIQTPAHLQGRLVLGLQEEAELPDLNAQITAKLDTGAANTSVDARNIQLFERDSKQWVKFDLYRTSNDVISMEQPIKDIIKIKRPGLKAVERPVISMTITIGELTQPVLVTLANREKYKFPLLVGRNFIQDLAVIDVNGKNLAEKALVGNRSRTVVAPKGQKSYTKTIRQPVSVDGLITLGAIESISLPNSGISLKARIDTGAKTSSLDARELEVFQKNKHDWVRFKIPHNGKMLSMEEPVTRFHLIKRHEQASERRPVITLNAQIGSLVQPTEFSLRSREGYKYPVLIGERFLKAAAIVDISKEYISSAAISGATPTSGATPSAGAATSGAAISGATKEGNE